MARNRNMTGRKSSGSRQMNSVYGRVRAYTNALISDNEQSRDMIDNMTLYKGGAAGGGKQSNLNSLRTCGVTHITGIIANRDMACAFMAPENSDDPTHCVSFKLIDGGTKIRGDWKLMQIIA